LVAALSELHHVEVLVSSGGDDTIDLFESRRPAVVVLTASLQVGDTRSLIVTLRAMVPRGELALIVIGDDTGPIRTALDALDLAPDRFVTRPLSPKALRFAVSGGIDTVRLMRGLGPLPPPPPRPMAAGTFPGKIDVEPAVPVLPPVPPLPSVPPVPSAQSVASTPSTPSTPFGAPVASVEPVASEPNDPESTATRAELRARWEALADSIVDVVDDAELDAFIEPTAKPVESAEAAKPVESAEAANPVEPARPAKPAEPARPVRSADATDEPAPLPPPVVIKPRRRQPDAPPDEVALPAAWKPGTTDELAPTREPTLIIRDLGPGQSAAPAVATASGAPPPPAGVGPAVALPPKSTDELWSEPMPVAERPPDRDGQPAVAGSAPAERQPGPITMVPATRDFARELRAKMSMMAQRLFQGGDAPAPSPADHTPRHDHHTEIDLASLGADQPLRGGTDIEARAAQAYEVREAMTSSGSWDSQVRERGLPDRGAIVRGSSDAAMLLARMFAQGATGRIGFRRDDVEAIVYFDRGRPVFASSNEPRDRMGELLLREGKITASQYDRCQAVVIASGRRMGEILVDLGYLKRRELLPAVRRHVEDIVYSLFGWERGTYHVTFDPQPSAERIRLSRHPAALILEGIRRKLDRTTLERLIGPMSTVIEVRDRERLGGIVHMGDLSAEERGALAAFDGQADLAQVARVAGVDIADVLPFAWGLCVLGLATARRADTEVPDDSTALVGETDLAIDRERVRARWQLVTDADYFALLGVRRDATGFEIRRAYQSARRDFAADCFPSDLRRELARELDDIAHVLDEAFRVLRDDHLRQTYLANLIDG